MSFSWSGETMTDLMVDELAYFADMAVAHEAFTFTLQSKLQAKDTLAEAMAAPTPQRVLSDSTVRSN
jgi:hypothetical protein